MTKKYQRKKYKTRRKKRKGGGTTTSSYHICDIRQIIEKIKNKKNNNNNKSHFAKVKNVRRLFNDLQISRNNSERDKVKDDYHTSQPQYVSNAINPMHKEETENK